jgi:hypothetical protein
LRLEGEGGAEGACDDRILLGISGSNDDLDGWRDGNPLVNRVVVEGFVIGLGFVEESESVFFEDEGLPDRDASPCPWFEQIRNYQPRRPTDRIHITGKIGGIAKATEDADLFAECQFEVGAKDSVGLSGLGARTVLQAEGGGFARGDL